MARGLSVRTRGWGEVGAEHRAIREGEDKSTQNKQHHSIQYNLLASLKLITVYLTTIVHHGLIWSILVKESNDEYDNPCSL